MLRINRIHLLFGLISFLLITSSLFANPATAVETTEMIEGQQEKYAHYYDLDTIEIGIIYDELNGLTNNTAKSLYYSISLLTPDVKLIPVRTTQQFKMAVNNDFDIAIYVFDSDHTGLTITNRGYTSHLNWVELRNVLDDKTNSHHIFAMGNSKQILQSMNFASNIHGSNDEKVDSQHAFVYGLWTLADVLNTHFTEEGAPLAEDIRMASLEYFANNLNQLIAKNMNPDTPLGEEAPSTKQERVERFYNEHPAKLERIPQEGNIIDPDTGKEINPMTGEEVNYALDFINPDELTPSDLILNFLPNASGLRGPMGGIVDELLGFLIDQIGDAIGLSGDTITNLANALLSIPDFIGAIKDPSASKMKGFLDNLKPLIPLPEDKLDYFDLLIDALFLIRGSPDDIINFIEGAISKIVPDLGGSEDLVGIITSIFNLGATAVKDLAEGDKFIDVVFSVLNEQIVKDMLDQYLNASILGISVSDLPDVLNSTIYTIKTIINTVATGDFTSLINDYLPVLLEHIPGFDGLIPEEGVKALGLIASIVMVVTGVIDEETIGGLLEQLFDYIFPELDNVKKIADASQALFDKISEFIESPTTESVSDIRSAIDTILDDAGVDTSSYDDAVTAVQDIIIMVLSIKDEGFSLPNGVDITSAVTALLTELGVTSTDQQNTINEVINILLAVVNFIDNPPSLSSLMSDFLSGDITDLQSTIEEVITFFVETIGGSASLQPGSALSLNAIGSEGQEMITKISEAVGIILNVIDQVGDNSVEGILMALLQGGAYVVTQFTGVDISAYTELATSIFGKILGYFDSPPSLSDILADIQEFIPEDYQDEVESIVSFILGIQDIFTGGFQTVFAKLGEWLAGQVTQLIESVTGEFTNILDQEEWALLAIDIPIGIGDFSLFDMKIELGLKPGFGFNEETFYQMIFDLVFKGISIFSGGADAGDVLKQALKFLNIHPIFTAKLTLDGFGSGSSSFVDFMLSALGVELSFSGSGFFELSLLSFKNGAFNIDDFFKVLGWGFSFTLTLSRTFTLLDFLTGGAGGSLNSIGKYIGLDSISITIAFTIMLEIIKRAATANKPETGSLTISLTIAFTVSLGIDITIAKLILTGTLEITLTLLQDLVEPVPLRVFISVVLIITVTIGFLFWDWDFEFRWSPSGFSPENPYELTPNDQASASEEGALGADFDNDGLSNDFEKKTPGLDPNKVDSDGDTLDDKFETQTLNTDPGLKDTDGDGINDNIEIDMKTDPLNPDSDFDGLDDYEESAILGTNPLAFDTDEDGLDDYFEVNHAYNMTGITPTVQEVIIGGKSYTDHTDPLVKDTDGDGLIDGNEGARGIYYGPELADNSEEVEYTPDPPLIFNGGYTHPLDADTDDDGSWQLYDGSIAQVEEPCLTCGTSVDMTDYGEIYGNPVIYIDPETGEPEPEVLVRTNPVNPDSDGDTGATAADRENPPFGLFINSDGYELTRDPPSDPLDGDTDDDGLMDGLEGVLRPDSNHTDVNNPDTDGDGLADMQEIQLGTDPRSVDTDLDGVSDGDEFFVFGTSPFLADHDGDGLEDGEELFIYHSSPFQRDSDADGIPDYDEVWIYFSDPMDEDSDNDFLTDYEEIFIHYTDPFTADTDGDGLFDGEEVEGLPYIVQDENGTEYEIIVFSDPLKWDTDGDSLLTEDQDGMISQSMSDGDEFKLGTRPDRMDTDFDGIQDGWELWLGKGKIKEFEPVKLDPLNPDTDGDTLRDGAELIIANQSTLLYPYIGFYVIRPYNTSAVNSDTDSDAVPDNIEIEIGSFPDNNDTDNDTLSDSAELYVYGTSLLKNDTDGDGLYDWEEIQGYDFPADHPLANVTTQPVLTDPTENDSDGDLLPDGAEVYTYGLDPRNPDQNENNVLDGMERDSDGDGLMDGEEYYVHNTIAAAEGGGPFQPDSDRDGLFDGLEVYESMTLPDNWDTDNDTYSDGLEYQCGTDPLDNSTTLDEFQACFDSLSRMIILSPVPGKIYRTSNIPVLAYDPDNNITAIEFQYKYGVNLTQSSPTINMVRDNSKLDGYWKAPTGFAFVPTNGSYEIEFTGLRNDGESVSRTFSFNISSTPDLLEILTPKHGQVLRFNTFNQTQTSRFRVNAGSSYSSVKLSLFDVNGTALLSNETMTFQSGIEYIYDYKFDNIGGTTNYTLQIMGEKANGDIVTISSLFAVRYPTTVQTVITIAAPVVAIGTATIVVRRGGFKNPFRKSGGN